MCLDMYTDMCIHMCMHMCNRHVRAMCTGMHTTMCINMCHSEHNRIAPRHDEYRHVYRHVYGSLSTTHTHQHSCARVHLRACANVHAQACVGLCTCVRACAVCVCGCGLCGWRARSSSPFMNFFVSTVLRESYSVSYLCFF